MFSVAEIVMALDTKPFEIVPGAEPRFDGDNFRLPTGRGVLSAGEVEALLRPNIPDDMFEEPETVEPQQLAELEPETNRNDLALDAATLAARLTLALRQSCGLDAVIGTGASRYAPLSFLVSKHEGELVLVLFSDASGAQVAGLTVDAALVGAMIDGACGGAAGMRRLPIPRKFSQLDLSILAEVLRPLATALDPGFSIACIEPSRSAAHALLPPGKAMLAELSCEVSGLAGRAAFARLEEAPVLPSEDLALLDHTDAGKLVTVLTARIATLAVPISRLTDLKAGSVLLLGLPTDQPVELLSGDHRGDKVAEGDVGRKGEHIAVRITRARRTFR